MVIFMLLKIKWNWTSTIFRNCAFKLISPRRVQKENRRHRVWDDRWNKKTPSYLFEGSKRVSLNVRSYQITWTRIEWIIKDTHLWGFTTVTWGRSSWYKSDPSAFLFSLTNIDNKPRKMKIVHSNRQYANECDSQNGPAFGEGHDI